MKVPLQRLYSTFANGWPGKGLIVLRFAIAGFLLYQSVACVSETVPTLQPVFRVFITVIAVFLLAGLWTPIVGVLAALSEVWIMTSKQSGSWDALLATAIALALALLGPGANSVDALAYGRKRISIKDR